MARLQVCNQIAMNLLHLNTTRAKAAVAAKFHEQKSIYQQETESSRAEAKEARRHAAGVSFGNLPFAASCRIHAG
jgi:hypothetical protein